MDSNCAMSSLISLCCCSRNVDRFSFACYTCKTRTLGKTFTLIFESSSISSVLRQALAENVIVDIVGEAIWELVGGRGE